MHDIEMREMSEELARCWRDVDVGRIVIRRYETLRWRITPSAPMRPTSWSAAGANRAEILADYPLSEEGDITAELEYAARKSSDHPVLRVA
jgi:hypothetical protein